jgi:hypothetical protein
LHVCPLTSLYHIAWRGNPEGGQHKVPWVSEPHVAEQVLVDMLHEANVTLLTNTRITEVEVTRTNERGSGRTATATTIVQTTTATGQTITAVSSLFC